jgi:NodT family efflux transporter outer membrane factor (OMF) lipoprotein
MRRLSTAAWLASAAALASCNLAPRYAPPTQAVPTAYKEVGPWTPASPADAAPRGEWWTIFGDATLDELEQKIDTSNPDLALALSRYDEAQAYAAEARSAQYPQVDVGGYATTNRQSASRPLRIGGPAYYGNDAVQGGASYEVDLWGRVRNLVAAGKYQAQASGADAASVRLSLEAELADAYLSLRGLDAEAKLLADTTQAYTIALHLTETLHNGGAVAGLDVGRAQTQLQIAMAQETDVRASRTLFEHEIAALVGEPASNFSLAPVAQLPAAPEIPVAAPSLILQRRPDIAAAERRAEAANAMIGVSRAAFFPSIVLDATGGFQNTGGINLLSAANSWWTLGPTLAMTLFDGGYRKAALRATRDQFDEAGDSYRSTVLMAFQQVEDNLALCNRLADEEAQQAAGVTAAQHTENLAMVQYKQGETTYLEVVIAQTTELQAEVTALAIATRRLQAGVDLVRALGGGWTEPTAKGAGGWAPPPPARS